MSCAAGRHGNVVTSIGDVARQQKQWWEQERGLTAMRIRDEAFPRLRMCWTGTGHPRAAALYSSALLTHSALAKRSPSPLR